MWTGSITRPVAPMTTVRYDATYHCVGSTGNTSSGSVPNDAADDEHDHDREGEHEGQRQRVAKQQPQLAVTSRRVAERCCRWRTSGSLARRGGRVSGRVVVVIVGLRSGRGGRRGVRRGGVAVEQGEQRGLEVGDVDAQVVGDGSCSTSQAPTWAMRGAVAADG